MNGKLLLGIDNGGTAIKAVLFTAEGREVASASASTPMFTNNQGFTERDMEQLWQTNCEVIRGALKNAGADGADITGISFSGHGKGLYLWGKDSRPARYGIVSTDTRAHRYVERWNRDGTAGRAFERTLQSVLACQPVALLRWIRDHEPGVLDRTEWIFGVKDYVRYRMTGEAYGEITDLSGSGLVNLLTAGYDGEILKLFGLEQVWDKLPPLCNSLDVTGRVTAECAACTGLLAGTPVAAGLFDIDACAVAMDVSEREIAVIAGTWSINEYISRQPVTDRSVKMNSLYCLPGYYLCEESSPTSASNLEWFLQQFFEGTSGERLYGLANQLVGELMPDDVQTVFLPYLYGGADDAGARAAFVGMDGSCTRAHLVRAVYEGVVFGHRMHIARLLKNCKDIRALRLAGGVVNSPLWVQMFADVMQMPVETIAVKELGALGAAMAAAVASGMYPNLKLAAAAMVEPGQTYLPNLDFKHSYDQKYRGFERIARVLAPCWPFFHDE